MNRSNNFIIHASSQGQSMSPIIKDGCRLEVNLRKRSNFRIGDIITLILDHQLAAHRIIGINKKGRQKLYKIKGDNNIKTDGLFAKKMILGKVEKIFYSNYTVNLNTGFHQILKYFFVVYSILNIKLNFVLSVKKIGIISWLRIIYRKLMSL